MPDWNHWYDHLAGIPPDPGWWRWFKAAWRRFRKTHDPLECDGCWGFGRAWADRCKVCDGKGKLNLLVAIARAAR
jgi:hypothetical protein